MHRDRPLCKEEPQSAAAQAQSVPRSWGQRSTANIAFLVHSPTGLWLTAFLASGTVTGTITALFAEIDWLNNPGLRVRLVGTRVRPGALYDTAIARCWAEDLEMFA